MTYLTNLNQKQTLGAYMKIDENIKNKKYTFATFLSSNPITHSLAKFDVSIIKTNMLN